MQVFVLLLVVAGMVVTTAGLGSEKWEPQEFALRQVIPAVDKGTPAEQQNRIRVLKTFSTERYIADHLDSLNLREGTVVTSVVKSFAVLSDSGNQKQFVIPSDEDFITILNNPPRVRGAVSPGLQAGSRWGDLPDQPALPGPL